MAARTLAIAATRQAGTTPASRNAHPAGQRRSFGRKASRPCARPLKQHGPGVDAYIAEGQYQRIGADDDFGRRPGLSPTTIPIFDPPLGLWGRKDWRGGRKVSDSAGRIKDVDFTTPVGALESLGSFSGPVIVDLDETLYLSNSTEDYISLARPYVLLCYLLRLLGAIKPWRWTGGDCSRDNWHVLVVSVFFPWTLVRWRRFCRTAGTCRMNNALLDALLSRSEPVIIATNGYRRLVRPLLERTQASHFPLVSCSTRAFGDRSCGKVALVERSHGTDLIGRAAMVTDSLDDRNILSRSSLPLLTQWPNIHKNPQYRDFAYIPGDYLNRVKQPGVRVWRILLREDVLPWLLMCLSGLTITVPHIAGSLLLFFSFWSIYEAGYFDNDKCAARYEGDPQLKPEFARFTNPFLEVYCWVWAIGLGAAAVWLIHPDRWYIAGPAWLCVLFSCRMVYHFYNRVDKDTRVFVYPVLQAFRFGSPIAIIDLHSAGAALILSQIIPRWFEYAVYRYQRKHFALSTWPKVPARTLRLITFLLLLVAILIARGMDAIMAPASLALLLFAYAVYRFEARELKADFRRLNRMPVT